MPKVIAARKLFFKGKEIQAYVQGQEEGGLPKFQIVVVSRSSSSGNTFVRTYWDVKPCKGLRETTQQKAIRRLNAITPEKASEWLERQEARNARRAKGQKWLEENTALGNDHDPIHS